MYICLDTHVLYLMREKEMYSPTMTNHDVLVHEMWFFWIFWKMTESVKRSLFHDSISGTYCREF